MRAAAQGKYQILEFHFKIPVGNSSDIDGFHPGIEIWKMPICSDSDAQDDGGFSPLMRAAANLIEKEFHSKNFPVMKFTAQSFDSTSKDHTVQ